MAFMRKTKLIAAVAVLAVTVGLRMASGFAKDAEPAQTLHGPPAPRYWPAAATQPSSTQPVDIPETHMHTPAQTMAMTRLPPGYRLELVASEPDLISPVCLAWDGDGRMYVAEMRSYMLDLDAHHEKDPISRVSICSRRDQFHRTPRSSCRAPRPVRCSNASRTMQTSSL